MSQAARAELIEDRGMAASSDEFFRSPPFLEAEGVTHSLESIPLRHLAAPLIVREIDDGPGATISPTDTGIY